MYLQVFGINIIFRKYFLNQLYRADVNNLPPLPILLLTVKENVEIYFPLFEFCLLLFNVEKRIKTSKIVSGRHLRKELKMEREILRHLISTLYSTFFP